MIPLHDDLKSKSFPWFVWVLILANAYIFSLEFRLQASALDRFIGHWGLIPRILFSEPIQNSYRVASAMFVHGGWLHILFNMLFLFVFGARVEDQLGHAKFLLFYLIVGCVANMAQAYILPRSTLPLIGASGAIAGVLGAYFFYFPHSRITALIPLGFFITIREIPAFFFLGLWFVLQMLNGTAHLGANSVKGGIAWWAHACGFMAGILLAPMFRQKMNTKR